MALETPNRGGHGWRGPAAIGADYPRLNRGGIETPNRGGHRTPDRGGVDTLNGDDTRP